MLYSVLELLRSVAIMVSPVMPTAAREIWSQLGNPPGGQNWQEALQWGLLPSGTRTTGPQPIFPRIEEKLKKEEKPQEAKVQAEEQNTIGYDEFKKLDIRIAEVKRAEKVAGADKLLQLTLDDGQGERQIVAGIALWYEPESLVGKKIVLLANLQPAKIRGVESQGMLLAADIDGRAVILRPDEDVPAGSKVR